MLYRDLFSCEVTRITSKCLRMQPILGIFLIVVLKDVGSTTGLTDGLDFTMEVNDPTRGWSESKVFHRGNDVKMTCATSDGAVSTLIIRKQDEENDKGILAEVHANSCIHHILHGIDCGTMGTYVCEDAHDRRKNFDLGIYNCDPLPCEEKSKTRTEFADLNETKNFVLCILAYPDISLSALINQNSIRASKNGSGIWNWNFEERTSSTYTVKVTIQKMREENYGAHNLTISTSQQGQKMLEYTLILRRPGPPDCPSGITDNSVGAYDVTLSWKKGLDGGTSQWFLVSYTTATNERWIEYDNVTNNSVVVSGLTPNTRHNFRVVPGNKHGVNKSCGGALTVKTKRESPPANMSCPAVVNGRVSSSVICKIQSLDLPQLTSVTFRKSNSPTQASFCRSCSSTAGYEAAVKVVKGEITAVLTIEKVSREDQGEWSCMFTFGDADPSSSQCPLNVYDATSDTNLVIGAEIIVGVVAFVIIMVLIIIIIVVLTRRRKTRMSTLDVHSDSSDSTAEEFQYCLVETSDNI